MTDAPDQIWLSPVCDTCKVWPQQSYSEKPKNCDFVIDAGCICGKEPIQYVRADLSIEHYNPIAGQIHKNICVQKDDEIAKLKKEIVTLENELTGIFKDWRLE